MTIMASVLCRWGALAICVAGLFLLDELRLMHSNFPLYLLGIIAAAVLAIWAASFRARPENNKNDLEA